MFKDLKESIISLNNGVKTVANCEKAKKLRKNLISIGLPIAIIGIVGAFVCFILFSTAGFDAFGENGFTARLTVPLFLFIPLAIIGGFGVYITSLGVKIVVAGYTTNVIDEQLGNNCPKCGDEITDNEMFCSKCGEKVRIECTKCQHINNIKSEFCEKCGNKL